MFLTLHLYLLDILFDFVIKYKVQGLLYRLARVHFGHIVSYQCVVRRCTDTWDTERPLYRACWHCNLIVLLQGLVSRSRTLIEFISRNKKGVLFWFILFLKEWNHKYGILSHWLSISSGWWKEKKAVVLIDFLLLPVATWKNKIPFGNIYYIINTLCIGFLVLAFLSFYSLFLQKFYC